MPSHNWNWNEIEEKQQINKFDQIELKIRFLKYDEKYKDHRTKVDYQAWSIMP